MSRVYINIISLILYALSVVYLVFMLLFLNDTKKYENKMSKRDSNFRKVAYVITWIELILSSLILLAIIYILFATYGNIVLVTNSNSNLSGMSF
jgi:hypothetical protein